nr:MAG TPA: hypothetical protein [Caudoviricetes sp.]
MMKIQRCLYVYLVYLRVSSRDVLCFLRRDSV